jgi:Mg-chelatase subunit ChlD
MPIEGAYGYGRLPTRPKSSSTGKKPSINEMRKRGIEVLFVFDTTASMDYLLDDVKRNIDAIYTVTFDLVRNTRFAAVAYRDLEPIDEYVVKSMDFTGDITEIKDFLNRLNASGGGDTEEAVQEALKKASKLHWRKSAHRVVILFTDAPSHEAHKKQCFKWADTFRSEGGYLHTVHVKALTAGSEDAAKFLSELAQHGGGTFVPLSDEIKILKKVFALVFPENNKEVEEALAEYHRKGSTPRE